MSSDVHPWNRFSLLLTLVLGLVIIGSILDHLPTSPTFSRLENEDDPTENQFQDDDVNIIVDDPRTSFEITNELPPQVDIIPDPDSNESWTSGSMAWDRRYDFTPNQNEVIDDTSESLLDTKALIERGVQTSMEELKTEHTQSAEEAPAIKLDLHENADEDEEFQELNNQALNRPAPGADPMMFYSIVSENPISLMKDESSGDNSDEEDVLREIHAKGKMRKHVKKMKMRKQRMKEYLQNRKYLKDQVLDVTGMDQVDARSPDRQRWTEPHCLTRQELDLIYSHGTPEINPVGAQCSPPNCLMASDTLANRSVRGFVICFSIARNWKTLFDTSANSDWINWFHGLRFVSAIWLAFGQSMLYMYPFVLNPKEVLDISTSFIFQILPGSLFAVDSFLFISGFLFTYVHQTRLKCLAQQNSWITWIHFYIRRFLAIVPGYLALILIISPLSRYFGNGGPFWPQNDENCDHFWWRDLTFLQNLWPIEEACVEWSWFVALYAQIVILVPLFLWFLDTIPILSMIQIGSGLVISIGYSAYSIAQLDPHSIIPSPENPEVFGAIFNVWYDVPWSRIQAALVGMFIGYLFFCLKDRLRQKPNQLRLFTIGGFSWLFWIGGWFLSFTTILSLIFGLWRSNYNEDVYHLYWSFCRPIWALALAWMTFATSFLSRIQWNCSILIPLGKLTYSVYLLLPVIMMTVYQNLENPLHFDGLTFLVYTVGIITLTYLVAVLFHLLFVGPLHGVKNVFLR